MKTTVRIFSFFMFAVSLLFSGSAIAQSLNDYLKEGAERNPALKARYQQYLAALEQVPQQGALPDPSLSFGYFISPVETRLGPQRARFSLQQMFPWFGSLNARSDAAAQEARVRFEEFSMARNSLFFNIKQSYFQLYDIRKKMLLRQKNIEVLSSMERLATQKYENDLGTMVDILRVQMKLRDERNQLLNLEEDLKARQSDFNTWLNQPAEAEVLLPDSLEEAVLLQDTSSLRQALLEKHPALQLLSEEAKLLEEKSRIADLSGKPNLGVGLDYVIVGERTDMEVAESGRDVLMPMVSMTIPLFNARKYTAASQEISFQQEANLMASEAQANELMNMFHTALTDYQKARNKLALYEAQIESTQQAISILNSAYETTSENFEDVLEFQIQLLEYQLQYQEALTTARIASAKLEELSAKDTIVNNNE